MRNARKFVSTLIVALVVLSQGACSTNMRLNFDLRQKVFVTATNNCSTRVALESEGVTYVPNIVLGGSDVAVLARKQFSEPRVQLTAKAYGTLGEYLGSRTETYYFTSEGDRREALNVNWVERMGTSGSGGCPGK